jgi:hypothetical protein
MMGQKGISMDKCLLVLSLVLLSCVSINYTEGVMDITERNSATSSSWSG